MIGSVFPVGELATIHLGDSLDIMPTLASESVDAVVTDPPAGIGFMGKTWDRSAAMTDVLPVVLRECFRIAKPGSVLLCWALPRTSHWTGLAIEAAGWQIEDRIAHHFGTGFPKHKSKLKPATEDWWLARKPGPKWLGVDECRVGTDTIVSGGYLPGKSSFAKAEYDGTGSHRWNGRESSIHVGRWPANLVLSHGPDCNGECGEGCPVRLMGEQNENSDRFFPCFDHDPFIYAAKASRRDRNEGLEGMPLRKKSDDGYGSIQKPKLDRVCPRENWAPHETANHHPTVKSVHLMRWLCRLACPKGGVILDPFMGSGSTGKAAVLEGFGFVGIEREPEYVEIAFRRISHEGGRMRREMPLFAMNKQCNLTAGDIKEQFGGES